MASQLPPLRALQAFEAFGRLGSVNGAAHELGVTAGAISQQLKALEDHLGLTLIVKDGRRAALTPAAQSYHRFITEGFDRLRQGQTYMDNRRTGADLTVSGLPTLMLKWLNPLLHRFQATAGEVSVRLEATHREPDPQMLDHMFRLTYGAAHERFAHSRRLFHDVCFPVCAPAFLERHPEARDPAALPDLPLIEIDWGPMYASVPRWNDWLAMEGVRPAGGVKPIAVHSLSSLALEAAAAGQGLALAQMSFARTDLDLGRLLRISPRALAMPEPYHVCWGSLTLESQRARDFLNWLMAEARTVRSHQD